MRRWAAGAVGRLEALPTFVAVYLAISTPFGLLLAVNTAWRLRFEDAFIARLKSTRETGSAVESMHASTRPDASPFGVVRELGADGRVLLVLDNADGQQNDYFLPIGDV